MMTLASFRSFNFFEKFMGVRKTVSRQIYQIRVGGFKVLLKKANRALFFMFACMLSIPPVLLIRLLHPFIKIRLVWMDAGRIGHFDRADVYLAYKKNGVFASGIFDIIYFVRSTGIIANEFYYKMWKRELHPAPLVLGPILEIIDKTNKRIPGRKVIYHWNRAPFTSDINIAINNRTTENILQQIASPISFTRDEQISAEKMMVELGIPKNKQFICFHNRDSAYTESLKMDRDWSYHDYRDSDVYNYIPAVEEMTRRGYIAIRMGSQVEKSLDIDNPNIIDYASSGKQSDFIDIYLAANCRFFILSDTGLSNPPEVFRKPILYVNNFFFALLYRLSVQNSIFIFKKYYLIQEERILTFAEIIDTDLLYCGSGFELKKRGIRVIENTKEEIAAATLEMESRLTGHWIPRNEDEKLQTSFWSLFPTELSKSPDCRIGAQFLRENCDLLKTTSS